MNLLIGTKKRELLKIRAQMLTCVRTFFAEREVIEVDTPLLSPYAPIDVHIEVMEVDVGREKKGYLHTSPEYALKKLLAEESGDIYQLTHVFRKEEEGPLHCLEFMMIEWYRIALGFKEFIEETLDLIRLFLGQLPAETLTYQEALFNYASIDCFKEERLYERALEHGLSIPEEAREWDRDTLLSLLFSFLVEPHLGKDKLTVITQYPSTQAALAKTELSQGGMQVALRFEVYFQGIELANGYDELREAHEQRGRFIKANQKREELGKKALPMDEAFLAALEKGLPDCRGVAVGFDRLLMLQLNRKTLSDILP